MTHRQAPAESRMEHARPVRRAGPGKRSDRKIDSVSRPDPYYGLRDGEIRCVARQETA
jgi:hypothetical protein